MAAAPQRRPALQNMEDHGIVEGERRFPARMARAESRSPVTTAGGCAGGRDAGGRESGDASPGAPFRPRAVRPARRAPRVPQPQTPTLSDDLGEPKLQWLAANHFDTDQPHAHVLVRGRREDGRDLVIPRQYIGYGFRARAQEVAHELLGELSRNQGEQRLWRDTQADQLTRFDRALLDSQAQNGGVVPDASGKSGTYAALLRGRLGHLEKLGLAKRVRGGALLHPQLEAELKALQLRRDVIRTMNERRFAGTERIQELGPEPVRGTVVEAGFHDELGAQGYAVIRDGAGLEHYARLRLGQPIPEVGREITAQVGDIGRAQVRVVQLGRER